MVYIHEAHSKRWPLGLTDHPEVQRDLEDRRERAQTFVKEREVPFPVYLDTWKPLTCADPEMNSFENTYHAWPDRFVLIKNTTLMVENYSQYDSATLLNDYSEIWKQ